MNTLGEQQALSPNVGRQSWIGLHRDTKDNTSWLWVDGSQAIFTDWSQNQPDNWKGIEDCVEMVTSGKWNDKDCSDYLHYVCEIFIGKLGASCSYKKSLILITTCMKYKT